MHYLWCNQCHRVTERTKWRFDLFKHGTCPRCGCSGNRNAELWDPIAAANDYPVIPNKDIAYPPHPMLF